MEDIEAEPSIIVALAYFLTRRGETSVDTVASKFMVSLEELEKTRREYQKQLSLLSDTALRH
ncbi:MAG: hypothetical protein ABSG57_12170 [Candidatus Bathyarchaeia archaeon]